MDSDRELSIENRALLLDIARKAIEDKSRGKKVSLLEDIPSDLLKKKGVFVTIKSRGRLRGCIGFIEGRKPLGEAVQELAIAAAFHDTRFPPVEKRELAALSYEISILSPLERIEDVERIIVGLHGIYIRSGVSGGLLLPQVALENRWDRQTFLEETCRKAGLAPQIWRERKTEIYIFEAERIS